ncbi:MAG: META domain-containing protein, partial [Flavobacteriales bacterium]
VKIDKTGKISGKNGCNSFFGQLNTEGSGLIQNLGSTRMACEGEADDLERAMMATLKEVTNITIDENFINFYSDDRIVLTGKELSLERGNWQVISIEGKEYEQMPSFEVVNNRMNGHTGCNSFFGMVAQNGFSLKILEPGMTEMECQDFDMKMESKFMQALGKITEYNKEGEIAIFSHEGKELFRALNPEQE